MKWSILDIDACLVGDSVQAAYSSLQQLASNSTRSVAKQSGRRPSSAASRRHSRRAEWFFIELRKDHSTWRGLRSTIIECRAVVDSTTSTSSSGSNCLGFHQATNSPRQSSFIEWHALQLVYILLSVVHPSLPHILLLRLRLP